MKQDMQKFLKDIFENASLIQASFSNPRKKGSEVASKTSIRPLIIKDNLVYQLTDFINDKALHRNVSPEECQTIILKQYLPSFKQGILHTSAYDYHLLTNKDGETTVLSNPATKKLNVLSHNRQKNYYLEEGKPLPFLIELGLMNHQGKIYPQKMAKFRQINRFLEMVEDTLSCLDRNKEIQIIDFGCGKAYLTFALYHFLTVIKGYNILLTGLDLKSDVIASSQKLAEKFGYEGLQFRLGDIADYQHLGEVDMVVALHACNTATDVALEKAIHWKAKVILSAPCCQHELYKQVASKPLDAILQHGILKERFAALATDAARAQILEINGYRTQVLEFIDPEHTPKNLMIRATYGNTEEQRIQAKECYKELKACLKIAPTLEKLIRTSV